MARTIGKDASAIFDAVQGWIQRCVLESRALFSEDGLWTASNLAGLADAHVNNPLHRNAPFLEKLKTQLAPMSEDVRRLATEMYWEMLLSPSNISPKKEARRHSNHLVVDPAKKAS